MTQHSRHTADLLEVITGLDKVKDTVTLDGESLTIPELVVAAENRNLIFKVKENIPGLLKENNKYLQKKIGEGCVIYGVNTGYGGSADVRSDDLQEVQRALVHHLNAGFGPKLEPALVRAVMAVRANSLCKGYSGVRPEVIQCLLTLLNRNIIPVVPKRGSISASGDLMPTSYIAACMMGRPDAKVTYNGEETTMLKVLEKEELTPIAFQAKEALAVVNAASFASSLGACILYDASFAMLMTQMSCALSVETLRGRVESFHPTLHACMPHSGQQEVAANITKLLKNSKLAVHELDINLRDHAGLLKQDRYALRSAAQWLSPALESLTKAIQTITIDINSANDNPIIDHRREEILHGANFQGTASTVAMDQSRQALQLCGKLLFAQMSEILNCTMNNNLPPNLCGSDPSLDFGLKGMDTAMASYMSELDYLTGPLTNHVLSAEMHNQSVNSLALISARMSQQALEILQMMLANITLAHVQAVELRWLQSAVEDKISAILKKFDIHSKHVRPEVMPWYKFALLPRHTGAELMDFIEVNSQQKKDFMDAVETAMVQLLGALDRGEVTQEVAKSLGDGTRPLYLFIRQELRIPFCNGKRPLDTMLEAIYSSIQQRKLTDTVVKAFSLNQD